MLGEEVESRCTESEVTTTNATDEGAVGGRREIERPRKAAETGGEGGTIISFNQ